MTTSHPPRWNCRRLRVGAVLLLLLALAGGSLLWQSVGHADAPSFTLKTHAVVTSDNKLLADVIVDRQQSEKLSGTLRVDLLGKNGAVLHTATKKVKQTEQANSYGFRFPIKKSDLDQLKLRATFGAKQETQSVKDILLPKGHETTLTASREFFTGSQTALQCQVHGVLSLAKTIPLPGANVTIHLRDDKDKTHELYKGKTDSKGQVLAQFKLPEVKAGQYALEIVTKSPLGEEKLTHNVRIRDDAKILLISDKPIYQPGQLIHIRALALRPFDLRPVGNRDILFEVEDSKGNKVFKKTYKTSNFGVASVDFQLADEVNMGPYQIRANLGDKQAQKTVTVKRYVLPKFKVNVTTDKKFYLPKETIKGSIQADYFFGKAVAGSKVEITASTFDVNFRKFTTWNGKTDKNGHVKFEIKLPDYFVGQPLQKGDAIVKLDVKIVDTADHTEKVVKSYPVSDQPIKISLIPEGGQLVPEMENRVFAAAIYPDGSPAQCEVRLWTGKKAEGKPLATVQTNAAGLAEFRLTPKAKEFRQGQWGQKKVEMLGGQQFGWGPQILLDLAAMAKDKKGSIASTTTTLNAHPLGENVLLRLDKAIYQPGQSMKVDVRTSAGLPTVYLDIVRGGQVLLSKWMEVKKGQAEQQIDLPPEIFGSLEVHAYQMLSSGQIVRDSRVVYVQPRNDLKIKVQPNKSVFAPGENGRIRFMVTDKNGKPTAAALGVVIVDEAVYALQELQPGLEKVYFTLQKELLEPQAQAKFKPADNLPILIRQPQLPPARQQVAAALLTAVKVQPPPQWQVAPVLERKKRVQGQLNQVGWALWNSAWNQRQNVKVLRINKTTKKLEFAPDVLDELAKRRMIPANMLKGPFGEKLDLNDLANLDKDFTAENLGRSITLQRLNNLHWYVFHTTNQNKNKYFKNGKWVLSQDVLKEAVKRHAGAQKFWLYDAWNRPLKLVKRKGKEGNFTGRPQFAKYEIISTGPDGKVGTKDDIRYTNEVARFGWVGNWWMNENDGGARFGRMGGLRQDRLFMLRRARGVNRFAGGFGGAPGVPRPEAAAAPGGAVPLADGTAKGKVAQQAGGHGGGGGGAAPPRIREYFPETMLWQPNLITNEEGIADMAVGFADSITTWRLTASANSANGGLGGTTVPLKVFQDFFVDIDLPVNWTQHDEVAFPVAVYNYLNGPQTVKIELKKDGWYELLEGGFERTLKLKPNEVTSVSFRIRANRIGNHPLTVMAYGSKKSDAVRRVVEVVPNGQRKETVVNGSLKGNVSKTLTIPQDAIPDSYKLLVRIYPGVMSQVLEGTEGMLRLPGG